MCCFVAPYRAEHTLSQAELTCADPVITLAHLAQLKFEISQVENSRCSLSLLAIEKPQFAFIPQQKHSCRHTLGSFQPAPNSDKKEHNNESLPAKNDSSPFVFSSHSFFTSTYSPC